MTLDKKEFIRRFILHLLPKGFMRIRFYGFLCNRKKRDKIKICKNFLNVKSEDDNKKIKKESWIELFQRLTGTNLSICKNCNTGKMILYLELPSFFNPWNTS